MTTNALPQKLNNLLQAEQHTAAQLLDLLNNERESLTRSELETIKDISAKKQPLVFQLEQLGRQREQLLQAAGFPADKSGLHAFIENQPQANALMLNNTLTSLQKTAQACQQNNQINGGIVNVNRQYLQKAMSILRGRDSDTSSYGPGGEYSNQIVQQPLLGRA